MSLQRRIVFVTSTSTIAACTLAHRSASACGLQQRRMVAEEIADRSFQPAEAEIIVRVIDHRPRKIERSRISLLRRGDRLSDRRDRASPSNLPALSKHSPAASSTVEPSTLVFQFGFDMNEHRVAAADNQRNVRFKRVEIARGRIPGNPRRIQMRFVMVNAEEMVAAKQTPSLAPP